MAPTAGKANYKSYEAQARLVRAMVAAHPDVKWNYNEIVACYGSDMTENALNHRFRHLKTEALIIREGRKFKLDPITLGFEGSLPKKLNDVDTNDIAKYFGQSTGDGIQFQFRTIKKDAEKLRQVESEGGDVASALTSELGSGAVSTPVVTPSKPTPRRKAPATGSTRKRGSKTEAQDEIARDASFIKREDNGDDDDEFHECDPGEETPSKRPKTTSRTPLPKKRAAGSLAVRPSGTPIRPSQASDALADSNSQSTTELNSPRGSDPASNAGLPASIFGPVSPKKKGRAHGGDVGSAFKSSGVDAYVGSQDASASMYTNASFTFSNFENGEI